MFQSEVEGKIPKCNQFGATKVSSSQTQKSWDPKDVIQQE
jgi:hypothetical protein